MGAGVSYFLAAWPVCAFDRKNPGGLLAVFNCNHIFNACHYHGDKSWLRFAWVKAAFLFWAACLVSAALSPLPAYSLGETVIWFRFPLFAMAVAFWLGKDRRLLHAMLLSVGMGMMVMCLILAAEISIVGVKGGRLSWPYGDLVPGNYLAKACLPTFVVVVAIATSSDRRTASWAAIIALISIVASVMTGERIISHPRL